MEQWQKEIIENNVINLIETTGYSAKFLQLFVTKNVISKEEKERMECTRDRDGSTTWACAFYEIICKKHNGFNDLLEVCRDPKNAQTAVAEFLTKKAIEAGKGHLLPPIVPVAPQVPSGTSAASSNIETSQDQVDTNDASLLPPELEDYVRLAKSLTVKVLKPTDDHKPPAHANKTYKLPPNGIGYAFIVNIINVNGEVREGADMDTEYMVDLMSGLGYKIFPQRLSMLHTQSGWTKEKIKSELENFKKECIDKEVDSIVVFVGSHGCENYIQTADGNWMSDYDFIDPLLEVGRIIEKRIPKIFITQACQVEIPEWVRPDLPQIVDPSPINNTIHIKAQVPKRESNRDTECGSHFVVVLVYVLMNFARDTSLIHMMKMVQDYMVQMSKNLRREHYQITPYTDIGLKSNFFFFN